jgi:hypothetical protein
MIKEVFLKFSNEKMKQLKKPALSAAAIIPAIIALIRKLIKSKTTE